jgi:predicted nucleotidyltransferase
VVSAVGAHPHVRRVGLAGSRARGEATELSDWDFEVEVDDFPAVAADLPGLVTPFEPLAQQWDRLSDHCCYMLMLRGPTKVDLLFGEPHKHEPPWRVSRETLEAIDRHFWDWALWLASKARADRLQLVQRELEKMHDHLLGPMGVENPPRSLTAAVETYVAAREQHEARFAAGVPRRLENEVRPVILAAA